MSATCVKLPMRGEELLEKTGLEILVFNLEIVSTVHGVGVIGRVVFERSCGMDSIWGSGTW